MSADLYWLSRRDKDLPLPTLLFAASPGGGGGCCYQPWPYPVTIGGREYDCRNGLIVVDWEQSCSIEATLAHEWRHHWQHYKDPVKVVTRWSLIPSHDYKSAIVGFFRANRWERDALRNELKLAACDENREWASWLGWNTRQRVYG